VERELSGLQMQLKLSTGPKKSALMMMRKKIEVQNERVLGARDRQRAAKKVSPAYGSPHPLHACMLSARRLMHACMLSARRLMHACMFAVSSLSLCC
jgi:hypothetical protein